MNNPKLHSTRGLGTTCVECGQNIIEAMSELCPGPTALDDPRPRLMPEGGPGVCVNRTLFEEAYRLLVYVDGPMSFDCLRPETVSALRGTIQHYSLTGNMGVLPDCAKQVMIEIEEKYAAVSRTPPLNEMIASLRHAVVRYENALLEQIKPEPTMPSGARMSVQAGIENLDQPARQCDGPQLTKRQAPNDPLAPTYQHITMHIETVQWLQTRMAALRLDALLQHKRALYGPAGSAKLLDELEQDLREINRVNDALA